MNKKKKIKLWYLLLVAFIQFPLKLTGFLVYFSYIYVYGIPLVYLFINRKYIIGAFKKNRTFDIRLFVIVYIYLFVASIIWPIVLNTFDFTYITSYWSDVILWTLKYTFLVVVYKKHIAQNDNFDVFAEYFVGGASVYSVVSLLFFLITPLRNVMLKIIYITPSDTANYQRAEYMTRFGWTGWSGFNETAVCTFAIALICILIIKNSKNTRRQWHYMLMMICPLIGNAMFGRIGLLASIICIVVTILFVLIKERNIKYLLGIAIIICVAVIAFLILKDSVDAFQSWYNWIFSAFENYRATGKFYDNMGTIEHLTKDMYWMPEKSTFLWGDGRYTDTDGLYYMHTDSGIMRPILYYGVINYALSVIGVLCLIIRVSIKISKKQRHKNIGMIMAVFIICIALFEFKGESLWMFIGMLFPLTLLENKGGTYDQRIDECI